MSSSSSYFGLPLTLEGVSARERRAFAARALVQFFYAGTYLVYLVNNFILHDTSMIQGGTEIVRRDALTAALKQLEPLADRVANLAAGTPKSAATASVFKAALTGGFKGFAIAAAAPWALPFWGLMPTVEAPGQAYSGAGYLTGPLVTVADRDCANRIRYELNVRLPAYGIDQSKWLTDAPWLYPQIKLQVIQLLKIATDLDVVEDDLDRAARAFDAVGEALMDLPQTLGVAFKATTDAGTTLGETLVWLAGGALAVLGVGSLITRRM